MERNFSKFFKILSIELQDLEDGLKAYLNAGNERYMNKEITEYVYKENSALLSREIADVRILRERIQMISDRDYESLESASLAVIGVIKNFTGIPEAVHRYMERKVHKVIEYITVFEKKC